MIDATTESLWRDPDATIGGVVAASWNGEIRVCHYCRTDEIVTNVRSPRWGEWEVCRACAEGHLAVLHGAEYKDVPRTESAARAAANSVHLLAMVDPWKFSTL